MKQFLAKHNVPQPNWVDAVCLSVILYFIVSFFRKRK